MVLAAPGPLLTPPPSSFPPKTPHRSYSAQTRSQNEEKNPPPKPYLPLQTRTRHRQSHRPHVPMLMRGNTPPTTRSPPHQSRPTGNPPNRQPATVSEEERGGRDPTSSRTLMRSAPDCRPPQTEQHASQPRSSTSHPPQQQEAVHRELRPCTGKGASACAGQLRLHTACCGPRPGRAPASARPAAAAPHDTSPANNNRPEEMRTSCRQQPAPPQRNAAKMSPRISIGPEPVLAAHAPSPPAAGSHCPAREGSAAVPKGTTLPMASSASVLG
jgi:hypothetical protein